VTAGDRARAGREPGANRARAQTEPEGNRLRAGCGPDGPTITLLSRPGCHLCDDARAVIALVAAELGVRWEERDIQQSADDLRDYGEMIPVTLIDGVQHDFWRVSEHRLRAALHASLG
jgi:hypothetical protein